MFDDFSTQISRQLTTSSPHTTRSGEHICGRSAHIYCWLKGLTKRLPSLKLPPISSQQKTEHLQSATKMLPQTICGAHPQKLSHASRRAERLVPKHLSRVAQFFLAKCPHPQLSALRPAPQRNAAPAAALLLLSGPTLHSARCGQHRQTSSPANPKTATQISSPATYPHLPTLKLPPKYPHPPDILTRQP